MSKIIGEPEPWPQTIPEEIAQQYSDTCAVKSQQIVMKTFGVDIPEDQLAKESYDKGYYTPLVQVLTLRWLENCLTTME